MLTVERIAEVLDKANLRLERCRAALEVMSPEELHTLADVYGGMALLLEAYGQKPPGTQEIQALIRKMADLSEIARKGIPFDSQEKTDGHN